MARFLKIVAGRAIIRPTEKEAPSQPKPARQKPALLVRSREQEEIS